MRVKMLKTAANNEGVFNAGLEYDLAPAVAKAWIARGAAEALEAEPEVEQAVMRPVAEKAVARPRRGNKV
jgi:hypothetical protein